jgi:hypothetical protein
LRTLSAISPKASSHATIVAIRHRCGRTLCVPTKKQPIIASVARNPATVIADSIRNLAEVAFTRRNRQHRLFFLFHHSCYDLYHVTLQK